MLRSGLFMYLTLATAIGPGFCAFPEKLAGVLSHSSNRGDKKAVRKCCLEKEIPSRNHPVDHGSKPPCKWKEGALDPATAKASGQDVFSNKCKSIVDDGFVVIVLEMSRTSRD